MYYLDEMAHTPFTEDDGYLYLKQNNIEKTNNESEANLYVTRYFPINKKTDLLLWRIKHKYIPILVWTDEPRWSISTQTFFPKKFYIPEIHIMNTYSQDIYISPFSRFSWAITQKLDYVDEQFWFQRKKLISSLCSYRQNTELIINNVNIDLIDKRQQISIIGYNKNIVDICGLNWPTNIKTVIQDRFSNDWHKSKLEFIKDYKFNIAIENTEYGYYISEKIWDPISVRSLPIYNGNNYIYKIFPHESFIDIKDFSNIDSMFNYIINMSAKEYCQRLNKCIEVYNNAFNNIDFKKERLAPIHKIIEKIRAINYQQ